MSEETRPPAERLEPATLPTQRSHIRNALRAPGGMRQAMLLTEILLGPVAKRRTGPGLRGASR